MYKYDIPFPNKEQYTLLFGHDAKSSIPINVAKSVSYLKTKMKAHRDEMGANDIGVYSIVAPDGSLTYTHTFNKGELGNSSAPYHVIVSKPNIAYKRVYLYDPAADLTEIEREHEYPITFYDAICNDDGAIATDLKLLKHLSNFLYRERIPVMVTKKALVSMATYLPQDKESFINLAGTGEKLYITFYNAENRLISVLHFLHCWNRDQRRKNYENYTCPEFDARCAVAKSPDKIN